MMGDRSPSSSYSTRSPGVKRLMKEAMELRDATEMFYAQPLEENLFEWHFTIRGPPDTEFEGGLYHGRIILPHDYPMKPPSIMMMTPNGRFELNKKICLSISGYHPESWQPSWSIRTALLAIVGFMPSPGAGAIGSLDYTPAERSALAARSCNFTCPTCGVPLRDILPPLTDKSKEIQAEAKELGKQLLMQGEKPKTGEDRKDGDAGGPDASPNTDSAGSETRSTSERDDALPFSYNAQRDTTGVTGLTPSPSRAVFEATPAPFANNNVANVEAERTLSSVLIAIVTLMLAALVLRRFFLVNEWRFQEPGDDGEL